MAIVTWMVQASEGFLDGIAETTFGSLVGAAGTIGALLSALAIVLVAVNMTLQYRVMDARTSIMLIIKLGLVSIFAVDWSQFSTVADALESGIQTIAGEIIGAIGGSSSASTTDLAARFDEFLDYQQRISNTAIERMNWVGGGVWGVFSAFLLGLTAALSGAVLIFAKIMLTLYVGIAPVMIIMSIFPATSDYFKSWLSGLISYMMYPLVIASVFAVIFGMTDAIIARMSDPVAATSLGQLLPFIVMVILSIIGIILVPMIVRQLSGNINLISPMSGPMTAISLLAAARMAGATKMLGAMAGAMQVGRGAAATAATATATATSSAAARLARSNRIQGGQ